MNKVKNFELETILTMTTGYSYENDFNKVFELVWFICDDNNIGTIGLETISEKVKKHLLTIHPELKNIKYQEGKDISEFVSQQKERFGSALPVTKLGVELPEEYNIGISHYIPSNDSEVIARLIERFKYDPSKTSEILAKYPKPVKSKSLSPSKQKN